MLTKHQLELLSSTVDQVNQIAHEKSVSPEMVATCLLAISAGKPAPAAAEQKKATAPKSETASRPPDTAPGQE